MRKYFLFTFIFPLTIFIILIAPGLIRAEVMSSFTIVQGKLSDHWEIMGEGERSWMSMEAANCYISWINKAWHGNISKMDTADGFSVRAVYRIKPLIGVGIGYERFWAEASGRSTEGSFKMETHADGVLAILSVRYPLAAGRISFNGEFALGYYRGNYKESEKSWDQKGDDNAAGIRFEGKLSYAVNQNISIAMGGGYRLLIMDNFGINFLLPGHPKVEMNYSGWFAGGGINYIW
jgi:opacity protein-like surface antigen